MEKKVILLTTGEPSGIGPDISLDIAFNYFDTNLYLIILIGDLKLLNLRAKILHKTLKIIRCDKDNLGNLINKHGELLVIHLNCSKHNCLGVLAVENANYVIKTLDLAIELCKQNISNYIVTAPISKEIINKASFKFSGHTEYFCDKFACKNVVMMLANQHLKVALLTTHIPLKQVSQNITKENLDNCLEVVINSFNNVYKIDKPKIAICGLNPHAGEGGFLGDEELKIINPVILSWQKKGFQVSGAHSADTIFNYASKYDVILAMYHDQGLPVLKYSDFETGINITLGLPILRTSVDHGIALDLVGRNIASNRSLLEAFKHIYQNS